MKIKSLFTKIISVFLAAIMIFGATSVVSFAETTETPVETSDVRTRTVNAIVDAARSKIGYYESMANEFTTWYYGVETEAQWCTIFVSWCADQGNALGIAVPKRATVESMRRWFVNRGEYYPATSDYVPQKGDIVFINTAVDGTDAVHHVEIVTESGFIMNRKAKNVKCIGGNTSDLNYNGSEYVTEKTRPVSSSRATIIGYAHPAYEKTTSILNLFYMISDDIMPAFFKQLYSKFITLIDYISRLNASTPAEQVVLF